MNANKLSFLSWIKKYPRKFFILFFVVFIPLVFLFTSFLITIKNSNRFYFDSNEENNPIYLYKKDLSNLEDLEDLLSLNIKFTRIKLPEESINNEDELEYTNGSYTFEISYEKALGVTNEFSFRMVLDSKFAEKRSVVLSPNIRLTSSTSSKEVKFNEYNELFPFSKYLIFNNKKPFLYIEITKKDETIVDGLPINKDEVFYIKVNLDNEKPFTE